MNSNPSEALLADILTTLANAARLAYDDPELQEVLTRQFGCSVESQRALASIHPGMFQRISFLPKILRVEVRGDYLERARNWVSNDLAQEELISALIEAGATRDMMNRWFGLSPKSYTARRRMLGLPATPGRPRCPDYDDPELIGRVLSAWSAAVGTPPERFLQAARQSGQSVCTVYRILEQAGQQE
jgi:hypothetical protein